MNKPHVPEPGERVGWLIVYGEPNRLHWQATLEDETHALLLAARMHGTLMPLVVGHHIDALKPREEQR